MTATTYTCTGDLLRAVRLRKGLPLRMVAKHVGITVGYLSDVERNMRVLKRARLPQMVAALDLSSEEAVRLFQLAQVVPHNVAERVLLTPELWGVNLRQLVRLVDAARAELTRLNHPLAARLASALSKEFTP